MKKIISLIMIVALMLAAVVGAFSVSATPADPLMITDYESVATGAIAGDWQDDKVTNNFTSSIIDSGAIDGTKCLSITANTVGDGPMCFWTPEKGFSTNDFSAGGAALGVRMRVKNLSDKESFAVGFTFDGGRDVDPQQYVRVIPVKPDDSTALKLVDMDGNEVTPPSVTGVFQMGDAGYAVSLPANFDGWLVMPYADCQLKLLADITGVGVKDDIVSLDKVPDYTKNLINFYYTVNADAEQLGTTVLIDDLQLYTAPAVDPSAPLKVVSDLENTADGLDMTAALNTDTPWDASAFASVYGANNPAFMDIDTTNPLSGSKSLSIGLTKLIDSYYACYWAPVITNGDFQMKDLTSTPNQIKARVKNTSATAASPFFAPLVEVKTLAGGAAFALLSGTETKSFIELYDMNGNKVEPAGYAACYPGSNVLAGVSLPAGFDGYIVCNFSQGSVYYKSVDDASKLDLLGNASMKIGDTVPYADFVQADADKVADVAFTMSATSESQLNNPILVDDIGLYVGAAMDGVTPTVAPTDEATVAPTDEATVAPTDKPTATENPNATTADAGLFGIIATAAVSGFAIYRKRK